MSKSNDDAAIAYTVGYDTAMECIQAFYQSLAGAMEDHDASSAAIARFIGEFAVSRPAPEYEP